MYRHIRPNRLVLPVHQHPQPKVLFVQLKVVRYALLERDIRLGLHNSERRQLGSGDILVLKGSQIKALVSREIVVRDDLGRQVEVLLVLFAALGFELVAFLFKALF
jgi:hypothetical protein